MQNGQIDGDGITGHMSRQSNPITTALGRAMRSSRGSCSGMAQAKIVGIPERTYYRLEDGSRRPTIKTGRLLARWLGWSLEDVFAAAEKPPAE